MGTSEAPKPESLARSRAWSNPYRFRLWFSNQNTDMFTERHKQMVYHFLGWGPHGCDSWNYRLMLDFHCSRSTIQRALRHLEKHALIDIRGALGKHRRIIAIPYPNRTAWMRATVQETTRKLGARLVLISSATSFFTASRLRLRIWSPERHRTEFYLGAAAPNPLLAVQWGKLKPGSSPGKSSSTD